MRLYISCSVFSVFLQICLGYIFDIEHLYKRAFPSSLSTSLKIQYIHVYAENDSWIPNGSIKKRVNGMAHKLSKLCMACRKADSLWPKGPYFPDVWSLDVQAACVTCPNTAQTNLHMELWSVHSGLCKYFQNCSLCEHTTTCADSSAVSSISVSIAHQHSAKHRPSNSH